MDFENIGIRGNFSIFSLGPLGTRPSNFGYQVVSTPSIWCRVQIKVYAEKSMVQAHTGKVRCYSLGWWLGGWGVESLTGGGGNAGQSERPF